MFDEYATQQEVYEETLSDLATRLFTGVSCCVLAYGQTGTGKTHTMLGEGLGIELKVLSNKKAEDKAREEAHPCGKLDPSRNPDMTEGLIPRTVVDVFRSMQDTPDSFEYTVRCSFVEIYLEKLCDLLQPWREGLRIGKDEDGEACILGASELCCLGPNDVFAMLARGNAYRTKSATDQNRDSNRSHAVFSLRIEKTDRLSGKQVSSRLLMLDLAGSELGKSKSTRAQDSPVALEGRMINASLGSLQNVIRGVLAHQGKERARINPRSITSASKLAQLLQPCFGGNYFTTLICTGSPSSYNIGDTINTIKFGQQARRVTNYVRPRESLAISGYRATLARSVQRQKSLIKLVKILSHECKSLQETGSKKYPDNDGLWSAIDKIANDEESENIINNLSIHKAVEDVSSVEQATNERVRELEKKLEEHRIAREKAESAMRDMKSDITLVRSQNEKLLHEKRKTEREYNDARAEIKSLTTRKVELEHHLKTSHFRENEAILFLRQFRTFYLRLLKAKAAHGSGSTKSLTDEVSKRLPGVTDLADLLDIDKLMVLSGIMEKKEIREDTNSPNYAPSSEALSRSAEQAKEAEQKEMALIRGMNSVEDDGRSRRVSIVNDKEQSTYTFGQLSSYRQKLLETPAGRLAIQKEKELERDLSELAKKCVSLQNAVKSEKAMVEALSARQGAMSKMKAAQELNTLKQELERKTNDLHAIVWKMNELHLVNKTIDTKVENREQHVKYLEEQLVDLQSKNRRLVIDRQEAEKRLRDENTNLKHQLDGISAKMWQLGESTCGEVPPWRLVVPCSGELVDIENDEGQERRLSIGNLYDKEIDGIVSLIEESKL